jgi:hypothetical protein
MAAIASASASVILFNIAILLVTKPEAASADWIASRGGYSARPENYCCGRGQTASAFEQVHSTQPGIIAAS